MGTIRVITTAEWSPGLFKKMMHGANLHLLKLDEASAKAINDAYPAKSQRIKKLRKRKK